MVLDFLHQPHGFLLWVQLVLLLQPVNLILLHIELGERQKLSFVTTHRYGDFHVVKW